MWVYEVDADKLAVMVEHCAAMKLVSGPNGEIYYANAAFREWSEYSMTELKAIGWQRLSVENESLAADFDAIKQVTDGYIQTYTIRKQYRTKSGTAHWGNLSVLRYPASGPVEYFFCVWEPYKNGTSTAFNLAMERFETVGERLAEMASELRVITAQTDEDRFVLGGIRMCQRHPRIAAAFLAIALSVLGANNLLSLLQRVGIVELPIHVAPIQLTE